jgi:hypothetical protein
MPYLRAFRPAALAIALAVLAPAVVHAQVNGAPAAARLTARDLARLQWIVGDWRGTGIDGTSQAPFFERYRFANDSTLLVESFADSTWRAPTETTRWELRGGRLTNPGTGAQWIASRLDARSIEFAPLARARNSFRWARLGSDRGRAREWRATVSWTDAAGTRQQRVYRMERVR